MDSETWEAVLLVGMFISLCIFAAVVAMSVDGQRLWPDNQDVLICSMPLEEGEYILDHGVLTSPSNNTIVCTELNQGSVENEV